MKSNKIIVDINREKIKSYLLPFSIVKKGYPVSISTILDTNYYYNFSGAIVNVRRKSFMSSLKLRSRRFGAEQRFFIFAPQLRMHIVSYYLSNRNKKRGKWDSNPRMGTIFGLANQHLKPLSHFPFRLYTLFHIIHV